MVCKKFFAITKFELNYHKDNQILTNDTTILPPKKQGAECAAYFGECKKNRRLLYSNLPFLQIDF
jgi:hypothetical protein